MILGLLTKVAGPRVLLGVILTGLTGISVLGWFAWDAHERAAVAESKNSQLRTTVSEQSEDHVQLRAELARRDRVVLLMREQQRKFRTQSRSAIDDLEKALENDKCANTQHPDAVTDGLRFGAGRKD